MLRRRPALLPMPALTCLLAYRGTYRVDLSHQLPRQAHAKHIRRQRAWRMCEGRWRIERIAFTDVVARSAHRLNDLIGDPVAADVAEGTRQTAGHDGVAARRSLVSTRSV